MGIWSPGTQKEPFTCLGHYIGPDLGDHVVGTELEQALLEGRLRFRVGVLFRPDLGKKQVLETILMLTTYQKEMWDYDHWEKTA